MVIIKYIKFTLGIFKSTLCVTQVQVDMLDEHGVFTLKGAAGICRSIEGTTDSGIFLSSLDLCTLRISTFRLIMLQKNLSDSGVVSQSSCESKPWDIFKLSVLVCHIIHSMNLIHKVFGFLFFFFYKKINNSMSIVFFSSRCFLFFRRGSVGAQSHAESEH